MCGSSPTAALGPPAAVGVGGGVGPDPDADYPGGVLGAQRHLTPIGTRLAHRAGNLPLLAVRLKGLLPRPRRLPREDGEEGSRVSPLVALSGSINYKYVT